MFVFPSFVIAGDFRVSPIKLEFDKGTKSGAVYLINEADEDLRVQINAMEWTQDEEGKDRYSETDDIIFFPRIMVVGKKSRRLIRVGIETPPRNTEKTYRLFVEEIPKKDASEGVSVSIAIRFGLPVFVKPAKEEPSGEIVRARLSRGELDIVLKNTGNVHFMVKSITVSGKSVEGEEVFSKEVSGWYLLSGISRTHRISIPEEVCTSMARVDILVKTDRLDLDTSADVDKTGCRK